MNLHKLRSFGVLNLFFTVLWAYAFIDSLQYVAPFVTTKTPLVGILGLIFMIALKISSLRKEVDLMKPGHMKYKKEEAGHTWTEP